MPEPRSGPEGRPALRPALGRGSGKLILVAGPSGAGKDTLIDAARAHFHDQEAIQFWQRIITREDQTGERHAAVTEAEFSRIADAGGFFLSWRAHGLHYGITADLLDVLAAGKTVVVNVSRRVIGEARTKWPNTHVLHITASAEVLRQRLQARGRETEAGIGLRLERAGEIGSSQADWISVLDNSGDLADGIAAFNALILKLAKA